MIDPTAPAPRPVSLVAVAAIFILLSIFGVTAMRVYFPARPPAPQNEVPDHLSKDMAWRATPASRRAYLADLKKKQADHAGADHQHRLAPLHLRYSNAV